MRERIVEELARARFGERVDVVADESERDLVISLGGTRQLRWSIVEPIGELGIRRARRAIAARLDAVEASLATPEGTTIAPASVRVVVARDASGAVVGTAEVERVGVHAVLRDVAAAEHARGRGIGAALVADRVAWVKALLPTWSGALCMAVWLVTSDAAEYFARLGFERVDRRFVPFELPAGIAMQHRFAATTDAALDRSIEAELAMYGTLVPPRSKYPHIPAGPIGWRMGSGEYYLMMWSRWNSVTQR